MLRKTGFPTGLLCLLLGVAGCGRATPEDNLKTIQGEWEVVYLDRAGKVSDDAALKEMSVTVEKDRFRMLESKGQGPVKELAVEEFVLQMDPAKAAGEIDFVHHQGDKQGLTRRGIYALEGDKLKLCLGALGQARPTEFAAKAEPACTLMVLQRK